MVEMIPPENSTISTHPKSIALASCRILRSPRRTKLLAASSGSKGVFGIALQLGLLTGILVFTLHEQLIPLILSQRIAPLTSLVTFCLNFLFISLVGAGIGAVAMRSRRLTFPVELALALGAVTLVYLLKTFSTTI